MDLHYKTLDGRLLIDFEATSTGMAVERPGEIQDVLDNPECQACVNKKRDPAEYGVKFTKRVQKGYVFYSINCQHPDCKAKLEISERKKETGGGFYAKRWDGKAKQPIENNGWSWYHQSDSEQNERSPQREPERKPEPAPTRHDDVDDSDIPF